MLTKEPLVSICIPTYNSAKTILPAVRSVLNQSYRRIEVIISDDHSTDRTLEILRRLHDKRIRIYPHSKNVGYGPNLQRMEKLWKGEIIYLMAHDDVLINDGIRLAVDAFLKHSRVGAVTRPYFWFDTDPGVPIRHIPPADPKKDVVISIRKNPEMVIPIIESVGQLSGLSYRRRTFTHFHHEVFPAHIYPFLQALKTSDCMFLHTYTVAVGTLASQTRSKPKIYEISPTVSWMGMFDRVFSEERFSKVRHIAKDHMARNYLGLVQLKNFASSPSVLLREILLLIRFRPRNLLEPAFWFYCLGTILIPRTILLWMVDNYKRKVQSRLLTHIFVASTG